ncbi:serine--tRNA ligase [Agrobacterium sp. SHOUNA12C]|uniref:Serine--tRNA ligase n=1 Tax=Rhizobium rhizogenes (strain K84 / ATCC BAA-868) TaxID=311403 RepID=SYS_RHIR8|nr:serine--tRNA ligase [Rhizobium rhizogenes]B9JEH1.1 RecName: Full=Serine--tRNA ligase; AltName: Full=Seryl-tRNA synthetase; Short=SerRS; AltName: Full=Seryl-tRNA(Ser/Sec) synthetase [Rhizobium rhizogenes K84]MCJ9725210.1 serine--tRNA ligase [Agrobacterium sp. BETTINA12B]MCJ9759093.1 serine--tRNA ligase [Agrobacterium sp. SHOUNA12C]OCJ06261.1 serine--tRNA ligase [Agrobacterium sp. 13-626]OCJ25477.1 serine--tRNA ligase [Agrobacterium sp. B131/95]ACM26392.1 seryl-tRNA synthetase (serine-tRNA l
MLDIKWIRENAEVLDAALAKRGAEPLSQGLIALDEKRRSIIQSVQDMQSRRNAASKEIGAAMAQKNTELAEKLKGEVADIKTSLPAAEEEERVLTAELNDALSRIPNIPLDDVPVGKDEHDNVVKHSWGAKPAWNHKPKEHYEIGEELGYMDFERAAKLSGSRFTVLTSQLARLERALGQFMLDLHTSEHGYTEVSSPLMVRDEAMFGTGQLPKFAEDSFRTTGGHWLIPTAEVTLTNLVSGDILDQEKLPLRFTALTPSFRSEAGSAGRDTRGMLRQHQFWKCELVSITDAESSIAEHERMTACAEEVLKRLGLHYRVMTLSTGDMGFGARKTYDLEVWLPGQDTYREISSCSVCGDFQARRMNARYRGKDDKGTKFVHTLNGSGTAVGRCLIAVLENYLNDDGSVTVPDALLPYMGGLKRIERAA